MPLNASERTQIAQAFLQCFGENAYWCGRASWFISEFTVGNVDLVGDIQNAADTWQPFIDSGLTISWWKDEVARQYAVASAEL